MELIRQKLATRVFCRVLDWNGLQNTVGYSTLNQGLSTSFVGDYSWGRLQLTDRQISQAYTVNTTNGVTGIKTGIHRLRGRSLLKV